ncbi:hypothetical protein N8301_01760 [Cyclobacteriaceae bacterium]|nr:hypothetical protein [Cyclobacteriaceae bacterium]
MNILDNTASIELIIAVIIGLLTVYLTKVLIMNYYLKKTNELNPYENLSFMIFLSGSIFSVSYIVFGIMEPLSASIKILGASNFTNLDLSLGIVKYLAMFLVFGYTFSAIIIYTSFKLFSILTDKVDEYDEISKNNIGVALLISILLIVIAMFAKNPFIVFVESFIPYPALPSIF